MRGKNAGSCFFPLVRGHWLVFGSVPPCWLIGDCRESFRQFESFGCTVLASHAKSQQAAKRSAPGKHCRPDPEMGAQQVIDAASRPPGWNVGRRGRSVASSVHAPLSPHPTPGRQPPSRPRQSPAVSSLIAPTPPPARRERLLHGGPLPPQCPAAAGVHPRRVGRVLRRVQRPRRSPNGRVGVGGGGFSPVHLTANSYTHVRNEKSQKRYVGEREAFCVAICCRYTAMVNGWPALPICT